MGLTCCNVISYAPAYREFRDRIAVVHFIGKNKPWGYSRFADGTVYVPDKHEKSPIDMVQRWWDVWNTHYGKVWEKMGHSDQ